MKKSERFGCIGIGKKWIRGAPCPHWIPPERAGIGGAPMDPNGNGYCDKEKRQVRRILQCPLKGEV